MIGSRKNIEKTRDIEKEKDLEFIDKRSEYETELENFLMEDANVVSRSDSIGKDENARTEDGYNNIGNLEVVHNGISNLGKNERNEDSMRLGDFSQNGLAYDGNNIIKYNGDEDIYVESNSHKEIYKEYDIVDDMLDENRVEEMGEKTIAGLKEKLKTLEMSNYSVEDSNKMYMRIILDLYNKQYLQVQKALARTKTEKRLLCTCYEYLSNGKIRDAIILLELFVPGCLDIKKRKTIFEGDFPDILGGLKKQAVILKDNIQEIKINIRDLKIAMNAVEKKYMEDKSTLKADLKTSKQKTMEVVKEQSYMKETLVKTVLKYVSENEFQSRLFQDVIKKIEELLMEKHSELENYRKEREKYLEQNKGGSIKESRNIEILSKELKRIDEYNKRIQTENLNFSRTITEITEKNLRLKKEVLSYGTDLKKAIQIIKSKNEIIDRQKSLIELFQKRLSSYGGSYPIDQLHKKKLNIESLLKKEKNPIKKKRLEADLEDCLKRLSDFLELKDLPSK